MQLIESLAEVFPELNVEENAEGSFEKLGEQSIDTRIMKRLLDMRIEFDAADPNDPKDDDFDRFNSNFDNAIAKSSYLKQGIIDSMIDTFLHFAFNDESYFFFVYDDEHLGRFVRHYDDTHVDRRYSDPCGMWAGAFDASSVADILLQSIEFSIHECDLPKEESRRLYDKLLSDKIINLREYDTLISELDKIDTPC